MTQHKTCPDLFTILSEGARFLRIPVTKPAFSKMIKYIELLGSWNQKFNLTSITDPKRIAVVHFLDSLTIFKVWEGTSGKNLLDIGSGAGFPGLVLKIVDDSIKLTLLDKSSKRIVFMKHVSRELGLSDISFVNRTTKDFFSTQTSHFFDVVTFRALPKPSLDPFDVRRLLLPHGSLIRMYSESPDESQSLFLNENRRWEGFLPYLNFKRTVIRYSFP
jgi:16S rRNA (guanine(527)-N(7))-methyltransferase RsmG